MGEETGNLLLRLIYLIMDHLMHDPKRACIVLIVIFVATMITGEFIGAAREAVIPVETASSSVLPDSTGPLFQLREIHDEGPVSLTPQPVQ